MAHQSGTSKLAPLIWILFILILGVSCKTSFPNKYPPKAATRKYLQMPKLKELGRFKNELPLTNLKNIRDTAEEKGTLLPILVYNFRIDKDGNVASSRIIGSNNKRESIFNSYIINTFNNYKWYPAAYSNTREQLVAIATMQIYEDTVRDVFEVSIRLNYLPEKENFEDILFEKNLICKFKIRSSAVNRHR